MASVNTCVISGRLVADAELRYTAAGVACLKLVLAVDGRKPPELELAVVAWAELAELHGMTLKAGARVLVQGALRLDTYTGGVQLSCTALECLGAVTATPSTADHERPADLGAADGPDPF